MDLTAFIMGDKAKYYTENGFSKGQILEKLIDELDKHFDGNASATILDFEYLDWAKVEYIEGAYSYPSVGSHKLRKQLARPIEDKIFFAGEATHYKDILQPFMEHWKQQKELLRRLWKRLKRFKLRITNFFTIKFIFSCIILPFIIKII